MQPRSPEFTASRSPTPEVRTLAVDDHQQFREALRELIGATPGFLLVGSARSGQEALRAVEELSPRLVLMDVRMPDMDGVEATQVIHGRHPDIVVVLISVDHPSLFSGVASLGDSVALARKQDLDPRCLTELWEKHGS